MIIDLHCHESMFSHCSSMSLEEAVESARDHGLDGLCITDHDSMGIRDWAADYLRNLDFPVFVGVEVTTLEGHVIAFGLDVLPERRLSTQEFLNYAAGPSTFCFCAHPFREGRTNLRSTLPMLRGLHGLEVYNGANTDAENLEAIVACIQLGYIAVAGSDAHMVGDVGRYATAFPDSIRTEAELVKALRAGEGRPAVRLSNDKYEILRPEYALLGFFDSQPLAG